MSPSLLLTLVWMHCLCDFFAQTDRMAKSKSGSMQWLSIHVAVYSLPFFLFGWKFGVITFCCHWLTDLVSSKVTRHFWQKGETHWFFATIGVDQALHMSALILTAVMLGTK